MRLEWRARASSSALLQQLSTLLQAGLPLLNALAVLMAQPGQAAAWMPIKSALEAGQPLSEAVALWPDISPSDTALLAMAEHTGQLSAQLAVLVAQKQQREQLQQSVRRALRYPLIVLAAALLLSAYLLTQVVPSFAQLYSGFNAQLPTLTRAVLALSDGLQQMGLWIAVLAAVALVLLRMSYRRSAACRQQLHRWLWRLPVVGPLYRTQQWQTWHAQMAQGLAAGIPLLHTLELTRASLQDSPLLPLQQRLIAAVTQGQRMAEVLVCDTFPLAAQQLIHIGEESGTLTSLLAHLSRDFEAQVQAHCQQLLQWIEPLLMVLLGAMIGTLVLALYMPLFELGSVMT